MVPKYENITNEIDTIKKKILKKTKNTYLLQYIDDPLIDDDKVLLLYMMFEEKKVSKSMFEDYIIPIILVQIALDTHETISVHKLNDDSSRKNRQLSILGGDFYSSLYYQILSSINDLQMIRTLAQGIQEINENKMQFYQTESQEIENAIENIRRIESALLLRTADSLHLPLWKGIAEEFLFIKRLLNERIEFEKGRLTPLFLKISKQLQGESRTGYTKHMLKVVDDYINHSKIRIDKFLSEQPVMENVLKIRLTHLFNDSGYIFEKTAEEG